MSRLLETIRIVNGRVQNIHYHNRRCKHSRKIYFQDTDLLDLRKYIIIPKFYRKGIVKCRISYNETIQHITYEHYKIKKVKTLQLVYSDEIDYQHKEEDREALKELYSARGKSDDIIIVKKGIVTDSYYCNLAFLRNKQWFTPANPLLHGTRRAQLLERKKIKTASIKATHIHKYEKVSLFNSMIPFGKVVVDISKSAVKK